MVGSGDPFLAPNYKLVNNKKFNFLQFDLFFGVVNPFSRMLRTVPTFVSAHKFCALRKLSSDARAGSALG